MHTRHFRKIILQIQQDAQEHAKHAFPTWEVEHVVAITYEEYALLSRTTLPCEHLPDPDSEFYYVYGLVGGETMIHGMAAVVHDSILQVVGRRVSAHVFSSSSLYRQGVTERSDQRRSIGSGVLTKDDRIASAYVTPCIQALLRHAHHYTEATMRAVEPEWCMRLAESEWSALYSTFQTSPYRAQLETADAVLYAYGTTENGFWHGSTAWKDNAPCADTLFAQYIDPIVWEALVINTLRVADIHYAHVNLLTLPLPRTQRKGA